MYEAITIGPTLCTCIDIFVNYHILIQIVFYAELVQNW